MKTIHSMLLLPLVAILFACSANKSDNLPETGKLTINVVKLNPTATATLPRDVGPGSSFITTLNLTSYNAKTGEVVFSNAESAVELIGNQRTKVNFYLNDQFLFSLIHTSDILSNLYNEPVLHHALTDIGNTKANRWYILSGYPWGAVLDDVSKYTAQTGGQISERVTNFRKIETNWNLFVTQLKKEGKYIN